MRESFLPCLVVTSPKLLALLVSCHVIPFGIACVLPSYSLALILSDPALAVLVSPPPPPCHLVVIVLFSLHVLLKLPYFFMSISSGIVTLMNTFLTFLILVLSIQIEVMAETRILQLCTKNQQAIAGIEQKLQ